MKTLTSLLVCCFIFISHCKSQDSDYSFKEDYDVSLPAKLSVSSSDGDMDVLPSDGKEIQVYLHCQTGEQASFNKQKRIGTKGNIHRCFE